MQFIISTFDFQKLKFASQEAHHSGVHSAVWGGFLLQPQGIRGLSQGLLGILSLTWASLGSRMGRPSWGSGLGGFASDFSCLSLSRAGLVQAP